MRRPKTNEPIAAAGADVAARIQSIHRAAAVLRVLAGARRQLGVVDLARELELSKTTTFGILQTLRTEGLVEQDLDSRKYRLGPALLVMGTAYRERNELLARALHASERLAEGLEQSVRLGTLYDGHVLVLHHVRRGGEEDHPSDVGLLLALGSSALGRVLVCERPDLVGICLSRERGTASERDRLLGELREITERGWTWLPRDPVPWQDSVAAPIRDHRGEIVAAIAISGPTDRLIEFAEGGPRKALVHKLVGAARAVSRAMEARGR